MKSAKKHSKKAGPYRLQFAPTGCSIRLLHAVKGAGLSRPPGPSEPIFQ
ncbi:MAG: hypothetical protein R6V86_09300 [Spirochaetia bacterium]